MQGANGYSEEVTNFLYSRKERVEKLLEIQVWRKLDRRMVDALAGG